MPRVTKVEKARKDYPQFGIVKGDTYYWWKFRFGPKIMSKRYPHRSQLTQSPFLQQYYKLQDRVGSLSVDTLEDLEFEVDDICYDIESLQDECQGSLDNMPEHLQESSEAGQILQERIDGLKSWVSELDNLDFTREFDEEEPAEDAPEYPEWEKKKQEVEQGQIERLIDEIQSADPGL